MGLNATPSSERVHIGIFGNRNSGKSSLINAMTGQSLAIVSDVKGTTTDPVYKAMELLPLGPVMLIDTPGIDDEGALGKARVEKSYQVLKKTDLALLVVDAGRGMTGQDKALLEEIQKRRLPYLVVWNKSDRHPGKPGGAYEIAVSAKTGDGIQALRERLAQMAPAKDTDRRLAADLVRPLDLVVLVVPIDSAAPKGRLILPQQQVIRDLLEAGAVSMVVKDTELEETVARFATQIKLVITDSQAFAFVAKVVPEEIALTSFSILFARYKGGLEGLAKGAQVLNTLKDGDKVLISEGCTHHRQCDDIGTVKLPRWIQKYAGAKLEFDFTSGTAFPNDTTPYQLVVHCGGCMLHEREVQNRYRLAKEQGTPMTNYGILIAEMNGILERACAPLHGK